MDIRRVVLIAPAERESFPMMSVTLGAVAAAVPAGVDVRILDGRAEAIDEDALRDLGPGDLVGLSFECFRAPRAYALARALRSRGIPVIAGGAHASAATREVLRHVGAVVRGEVEGLWERIIADASRHELHGVYVHERAVDLAGLRAPRLDLLRRGRYLHATPIEATRGCPHRCGFCTSRFIQGTFRTVPVDKLLAQVEAAPTRALVFMDDNLPAARPHARRLFEGMRGMGKSFLVQTHVLMAEDRELLKLAAEAGCRGVFIGLESVSDASLDGIDKGWNRVARYAERIARFHEHGIGVSAGIIFGLDADGPDVFDRTLDVLEKIKVDTAAANLLIPYPGTELYRKLSADGRIVDYDYEKYYGHHLLVRPLRMTVAQLAAGYRRFCERFYSWSAAVRRWRASGLDLIMLPVLLGANLSYRSWRSKNGRTRAATPPFPEALEPEVALSALHESAAT